MCLFPLMKVGFLFAKRSGDSSDADGRALLLNARRGVVLHHFNFHEPLKDIQFSPNGSCVMLRVFVSASTDRHFSKVHWRDHIQVWRMPNHLLREFGPFTLHRTYTRHHDDVLSIQWFPDSTYVFAVGSFRYRMIILIATQMLHHHVEGHDGSFLYLGPSRRIPTENVCRTPRCCFECLFFCRWQHSEFRTFSFQPYS